MELLRVAPLADELAERFAAEGYRLFLVGGSVRDALLGRLGKAGSGDLDFTTDATPDAVQRLLSGWAERQWDTGIAFGTIGAIRQGVQIEVTTFRADSYDRRTRNPEV
ncbi:MAG: poly(A) polymerase, partial [Pseudonocardiales bacterium]|nr:poly(A) polymerase [Pseudonocardiales bacterium]